MNHRRTAAAGIKTKIGNHTFRVTGITAYLKNNGTLEAHAAALRRADAGDPAAWHAWRRPIRQAEIAGSGYIKISAVRSTKRVARSILRFAPFRASVSGRNRSEYEYSRLAI
jgi:hypothetical protein